MDDQLATAVGLADDLYRGVQMVGNALAQAGHVAVVDGVGRAFLRYLGLALGLFDLLADQPLRLAY